MVYPYHNTLIQPILNFKKSVLLFSDNAKIKDEKTAPIGHASNSHVRKFRWNREGDKWTNEKNFPYGTF
jgi:hypothetical protein